MAYGDNIEIQKLVWGGPKVTVPGNVSAANDEATTIINLVMNRIDDYDVVPLHIERIANMIAAEIVRIPTTPRKDVLEMSRILLNAYKDQAPPSQTNWGNVWYI